MITSIILIVVFILIWTLLFYKEPFVITGVVFLNDGNLIVTVENSSGTARDFIGPKPEWKGLNDDMKPPKHLSKQLNDVYVVWTKYRQY